MGIPSYFNYILRNHSRIITNKKFVRSDYLFVDANSLIYEVIHAYDGSVPDDNNDVYNKVYESMMAMIKTVKPKYTTYLCFDGVPPYAKMQQQRQRRFKSTLTSKVLDKQSQWNTNQITPGTKFMNELDTFLNIKFKDSHHIKFSGSSEAMEGEHKICKIINSADGTPFKDKNLIIYGLDADLFMLGLMQVYRDYNIYLYKETNHFKYIKGINETESYYFNINIFSKQLSHKLGVSKKQAICDYCLLAFLCGNDFLPHLHSINIRHEGINIIIDKYIEFNKTEELPLIDIDSLQINWSNFRKYISTLVKDEQERILENLRWKISHKERVRANSPAEKLDMLPCVDNEREVHIYENIEELRPFLFGNVHTPTVCKNYLEMIEWTWYYYSHNEVIDNTKVYHFGHAPLLGDVLSYIPLLNSEQILKKNISERVSDVALLLYVIPPEEHSVIIPRDKYTKIKDNIYNELPRLKESNFEVDYFMCKYFWEGHLNMPHIDIFKINKTIVDKI